MAQRGHEVVLVLRELYNTSVILGDGIPPLQAPKWLPQLNGLPEPPLNYSEILMRYGYFNADGLAGLIGAWRSLFALNVLRERLENSDALVLNSMNKVLASYNVRPLANVSELFGVEENFICTFAELDHYSQREPVKYWGASWITDMGPEVSWPEGEGKCVFVYLEPHERDFHRSHRGAWLARHRLCPGHF